MDAQVLAALIQAIGSVLAAGIAGVCAALIGKKFADRQRLQSNLVTAANDIAFLLAVERTCVEQYSVSKLDVRESAKAQGYEWSGQFTASRLKGIIERNS